MFKFAQEIRLVPKWITGRTFSSRIVPQSPAIYKCQLLQIAEMNQTQNFWNHISLKGPYKIRLSRENFIKNKFLLTAT